MNVRDNPELGKIDFANALSVSEVPALAKLQAKRKEEQQQRENALIEPDVWQLIKQKADNPSELAKINNLLRQALA